MVAQLVPAPEVVVVAAVVAAVVVVVVPLNIGLRHITSRDSASGDWACRAPRPGLPPTPFSPVPRHFRAARPDRLAYSIRAIDA